MYTTIIYEETLLGIYDDSFDIVSFLKSKLKNFDLYDEDFQRDLMKSECLDDIVALCQDFGVDIKIYQAELNETSIDNEWSLV